MAYSLTVVKPPAAGRDHFGFNIYWARKFRDAMIAIGMAYNNGDPDVDELTTIEMDLDGYNLRTYYTGTGYAPEPTIPIYKLSSNDPWWITAPEIRAALTAYDHYPWNSHHLSPAVMDTIYSEEWHKWIAFLRYSERHNGFTVS